MAKDDVPTDPNFVFVTKYYWTLGVMRVPRTDVQELDRGRLLIGEEGSETAKIIGKKFWHQNLDEAYKGVLGMIGDRIWTTDAKLQALRRRDPKKEKIVSFEMVEKGYETSKHDDEDFEDSLPDETSAEFSAN